MSENKKIEKDTWFNRMKKITPDYLGIILCVILCVVILVVAIVAFHKNQIWNSSYTANHEQWGLLGDFFGGIAGTIVAIFSVYYLVRTLREQQESNKTITDNNKEVAEIYQVQQFENNYQHLIKLYQEAILCYGGAGQTGRMVLKDKVAHLYECVYDPETNYQDRKDAACALFDSEFYIPNRVTAAVHFRVLYQIFNLIEGSDLDESKYKAKYAKLVRSQIDEEELLLLRYNCWCQYGHKMRQLINHYNLLKHLPMLSLLEFQYWRKNIITDEILQNAIDTELIAQRKWIIDSFSLTNNAENTNKVKITSKYELIVVTSMDKKKFSYKLIRHEDVPAKKSIDQAFDLLGDAHSAHFICDFLHELFEYSNFNIYNEYADIKYLIEDVNRDADRKVSVYEVSLCAERPMSLKYKDYINCAQESMPQKINKSSWLFTLFSRICKEQKVIES